ncbi:unnamed protein product [Didymodactylos carnosus]|uniref:beta-N-acetylhexosaminidase n=1 Tax=Didymodactylos carnosus TaxID=1234261 RepID=A0A813R443_9BILA|nr:unnamed protein product [Didymodactylos carnosus]CAF0816607.1 unnamed protein product [Didymodactylos carnosus]CAF3559922.1 unnamed protein product [Didymodactylos carnosus]CAF3600708.1 unnamed protein product [Didymodactylos carnosus]
MLCRYRGNIFLRKTIQRFGTYIYNKTGIRISNDTSGTGREHNALFIHYNGSNPNYPVLGENEYYELIVSTESAHLHAITVTGVNRGLATFVQLLQISQFDDITIPAVEIIDKPRFPWRGLLLDISRHWMPVSVVERTLNAMEFAKLNVLHLHLTDDQGFRIESKKYPLLHQKGSDGQFFTQEQIRHLIEYANERRIRIIPEFDIPAHTTSWFVGYPHLASSPNIKYEIERHWGVMKPTMDPTQETTYKFLDDLIEEMASLFPDKYFHIGGDEVEGSEWTDSTSIQNFKQQMHLRDNHDLQTYFTRRVQTILIKHHKTIIGWDEILAAYLSHNATNSKSQFSPDSVIQSWRGRRSLIAAARYGYQAILSNQSYLDLMQPAGFYYSVNPTQSTKWRLNNQQRSKILGGEICLWSEYISSDTVDSRIWPRAVALAERYWSSEHVTNVNCMYDRLKIINRQLSFTGIEHLSKYMSKLKKFAGDEFLIHLKTLADVCEALGRDDRYRTGKYTSLVSMVEFVDALQPESETVYDLERLITYKTNETVREILKTTFQKWSTNYMELKELFLRKNKNESVVQIKLLSKNLSQVGNIGIQVLNYLNDRATINDDELFEFKETLDEVEIEVPEIRLAAVRPVHKLLSELNM